MVTTLIASKGFSWQPEVILGDNPQQFAPEYVVREEAGKTVKGNNPQLFAAEYVVKEEAGKTVKSLRSGFEKMPSAGIWKNRAKSDEELLGELGRGWRGFACEQ